MVEALFLGLMAPGESEAETAEELAAGVDASTLAKCKAAALETLRARGRKLVSL